MKYQKITYGCIIRACDKTQFLSNTNILSHQEHCIIYGETYESLMNMHDNYKSGKHILLEK